MTEEQPLVIPVIPMKPLADGKSRLSRYLSPQQRAELTLGMLRRVIGAIKGASLELFWVVGGDSRVRNLVRNRDGLWIEDKARNLNDTVTAAFERALGEGYSVLYLPGDLPFLKPSDIHSMLRASERRNNITLAPAGKDGGTNGILVPQGTLFRPELGRRSFSKHLSQAASLEISVAICHSTGLGLDLDTIDDLESFEHMEPGLLQRLAPSIDMSDIISAHPAGA